MIQTGGNGEPSLRSVVADLTREVGTLLHQETALAKDEIRDKAAGLAREAGAIAAGGAGAYAGALTLLAALVLRLAGAERRWWRSALLVGGAAAAGGACLAWKGLDGLHQADLVPEQTVKTLKEGEQWLKERAQ